MQPNQQERRFAETPQQQPVYRFPQNRPAQGWQNQPGFPPQEPVHQPQLSRREQRKLDRAHKRKRRVLTLWNLLAVIGMITVFIQGMRYIVIPLLVQLNILTGGAL